MEEAKFTAGQMVTHQSRSNLALRVVQNIRMKDKIWVQCCWLDGEELKMEAFPEEALTAATSFLDPAYFLIDE